MVPQILNTNGADKGSFNGSTATAAQLTQATFGMEALISHNKYRTLHNVPPLEYNENLSKIAQKWADNLAKTQQMQHSPENWRRYNGVPLGENLAYLYGQPLTGAKMSEMWYSEISKHDFSYDDQPDTQHFTQLVWRDTREVGFGRAKAQNGNWYYGVALYLPCGNQPGAFRNNIFPPAY